METESRNKFYSSVVLRNLQSLSSEYEYSCGAIYETISLVTYNPKEHAEEPELLLLHETTTTADAPFQHQLRTTSVFLNNVDYQLHAECTRSLTKINMLENKSTPSSGMRHFLVL